MSYDAIVIGAGPAGASAARKLAQQNLRVLILEKAALPRYKPCGGGLTSKALRLLDFDISSTLEDETRETVFSYDSGPTISRTFDHTVVWFVMRDKFDLLLAQQAVAAGAELRTGVAVEGVDADDSGVTVRTRSESLRARFLIGADGANGITAKSAGLMAKRHNGMALEAEIEVSNAAMDKWRSKLLFDFGGIPWGYAWIFPKAEHLSIGVGSWYPSGSTKPRERLARFIERQPDLREHGALSVKGHVLPLGGRMDKFHQGRVLLAGDAAATAEPFFGEGISFAIRSGQFAADEIIAACAGGAVNLAGYTRRINHEMNADFRFGRLGMHVFYGLPRLTFETFVKGGQLADEVVHVVEGKSSYRRLAWSALAHAPQAIGQSLLRA